MNERNEYLFVYGTLLRKSQSPMSGILMSNSKFIDDATVNGLLYDIGEYPGLVTSNSDKSIVKGEIFQLSSPDSLLKKLDDYEGSEYKRTKTSAVLSNGKTIESWVYTFSLPTETYNCIESGDYMSYLGFALT